MAEYKDIFKEDVEVPDIVKQKVGIAFAKIRTEEINTMTEKKKSENRQTIRRKKLFKSRAAAVACICLLAAASITAAAAVRHIWSRGMQGILQATDEQQQVLTDIGVANVLSEEENYANMAVTERDITVTPETVIADERFAYLCFSVKGYAIEEGKEPSFESTQVYLGDDPDAEEGWLNMGASFYNGIVSDEMGRPVYEDGTDPEIGADQSVIERYADADGTLEYVIKVFVSDQEESLLGKTLHVNFENLGTVYKAEYSGTVEGKWNFALDLPTVSSAINIPVEETVEGTSFVMDSVELSPVSIKINYSVNGDVESADDDNGIPNFCGVVLTDGTRLPFLFDGGSSAYTDENRANAYEISSFDRVIDPKEVASVLVRTESGTDMVEVPLGGE